MVEAANCPGRGTEALTIPPHQPNQPLSFSLAWTPFAKMATTEALPDNHSYFTRMHINFLVKFIIHYRHNFVIKILLKC